MADDSRKGSGVCLLKPNDLSFSDISDAGNSFSRDQDRPLPAKEKDGYVLHPDLVNPRLVQAQYAVRGELYLRAEEMRKEGRKIIATNVGNPHALGAQPITFTRQVISLVASPFLLEDPRTISSGLFLPDAVERAKQLHSSFTGGIGAYTDSRGNSLIRSEVADFIERRDGYRPNPEHIFLGDGASSAVRMVMTVTMRDEFDALLVPIPQYPLYSASCTLFGGRLLPYELDEDDGWGVDVPSLKASIRAARREGLSVRAVVVINPGNPTGQTLSEDVLRQLVKLCYDEKLVLLADEVYQALTFREGRPFVSAHKVVKDMGEPYASKVELISFHTVSKGVTGECGLRGGYMHLANIHPGTFALFYKLSSINLCPNTVGQVAVSCMVNPPKPGTPSYELYHKETSEELASLQRRAAMVSQAFASVPGMTCNPTEGGMYAFPQLLLPPKALEAAQQAGRAPDVSYCLQLLEETGICTVPGSGFGQAAGTHHFRTTILPREEVMASFCGMFKSFHEGFMERNS